MRPALSDYQHVASGKVREIYRVDDDHLLFVATDRISAYDYILDSEIPDKGRILTAMSVFFFDLIDAPNHLAGPPDDERIPAEVLGRALVVRKLEMLPVGEGYLKISAFDERDLAAVREAVQRKLSGGTKSYRIPAERGDLASVLYRIGEVVDKQIDDEDLIYEIDVNQADFEKYGYRLAPFLIPQQEAPEDNTTNDGID